MKKLFLFLFLSLNILAYEDTRTLLESIQKHAIVVGTGKSSKSFVFVDPRCPFSREFITTIVKSKVLREKTTYYIFLYRLPKYETDMLIQYIYESNNPLTRLKEVMVNQEEVYFDAIRDDVEKLALIREIAHVAKEIKVTSRPYLLKFEKGSKYCDVSHGTAQCEQVDCTH